MSRVRFHILTTCLILFLLSGSLFAAETVTKVKYISADHIFLDAGSSSGIAKGDTARIVLHDASVVLLEIVFVAESSSSAKTISQGYVPRVGDNVIVTVADEAIVVISTGEAAVESLEGSDAVSGQTGISSVKEDHKTRIQGRFGLELLLQDDREATNADVTRPGLVVRSRIDHLFMDHLALSVNLHSRRIIRDNGSSPGSDTEWNNRIYEVALQYHNPASPLSYQAGRISSNNISGIGRVDGAMVEYQVRDDVQVGVFGGAIPDVRSSEPQTELTTTGLYATYERGSWQGHKITGTLALAGRYNTGEIDREYLYEQVRYSWSRRLSFYQSSEISINRGWRKDAEGSSLSVGNILLNTRYSPTNSVSFDLGFDNRQLIHTYQTKDTPDSLFDDALRQGFRAGVNIKLTKDIRTWVRAGLRTRSGESSDTRTISGGITHRDLLNSGVTGSVQMNTFDSRFSTGTQVSLSASRYINRIIYLQGEVGQSQYKFESSPDVVRYMWVDIGLNGTLSQHFYASCFGEIYRGDAVDTNRIWLEIGYRL